MSERIRSHLTERNFILLLTLLFIILTINMVTLPYDPIKGDIADATTNVVWADYYRDGVYAVPYDEWQEADHPPTQSTVVEKNGEVLVVNEKGSAHAMMAMVLGPATGTIFAAIGVASTYLLGRRLFSWRVGAIASLVVISNLTLLVMWHRYWWVDSSTVHLLALSMLLFVTSGRGLRSHIESEEDRRFPMRDVLIGIGGGVTFGVAIATRYTVGLIIFPVMIYLLAVFWRPLAGAVKERDTRALGRTVKHGAMFILPFLFGLALILVPLMNYNVTYFGSPIKSGYDGMSLRDYETSGEEDLQARNQTDWAFGKPAQKLDNLARNVVLLTPIILSRMLALVFVPFGAWAMRKRPVMYLFLPWVLIIFLSFLSLSWVDMYANMLDVVQEPRYFMSTLPAVGLLAGYGIDRISGMSKGSGKPSSATPVSPSSPGGSGKGDRGRKRSAAFVLSVVFIIVVSGLFPAMAHFDKVRQGATFGHNPRGPGSKQPDGGPGIHEEVTIRMIYDRPSELDGELLVVRDCTITYLDANGTEHGPESMSMLVQDRSDPGEISVRLLEYPENELPDVEVGDHVDVAGMFRWNDLDDDGEPRAGELNLSVKYNTDDAVVPLEP